MTKVVWSALLATVPVICLGASAPWQDPAGAPTQLAADKEIVKPALVSEPGDAAKLPNPPSTQASMADDKTFVIGPEDQLEVVIWADNRIGGTVLVRPDGRISLNLLGEIQAAGRTPVELAGDIGEMLKQKEILRRPQVTVKVIQINSKKYMINGEVLKPGPFPLVVATRVMEALVNAGGFKDFANKKDIVIIRGTQRLKFNWNDAVKGKHPEQNVLLEPGDLIIVK